MVSSIMFDTEITAELHAVIEKVVRDELGRFGVTNIEVIDAEDHDGDPSILVLVHYRDADAAPDPKAMAGIVSKVNDQLYARKEKRFAYILHKVPEHEKRARAR